jgi:hypothetical protein
MLAAPFSPCVIVPIRPPHSTSPPSVPCSAAPHPLRPPLRYLPTLPPPCHIPHQAQSASPASTVLPHRRGRPARSDRLHRASEPPQQMLQQVGEGDEIRVTPCPSASCPCRRRTARSMRCHRSPRRRVSIRPSKTHVRVYFKCFRCFILMLQVFHLDVIKIY